MIQRCQNPKTTAYHRYGGRGISVCDEWLNDFWSFVNDVGEKPTEDHSIDRIDNDGNYEPGNVKWSTRKQQVSNTSLSCLIEIDGDSKTINEWSRISGLSAPRISHRLKVGISPKDAVFGAPQQGVPLVAKTRAYAKLTDDQVREIDELLRRGVTHREIASMMNVGKSTIGAIAVGQTWTHITNR